MRCYAGERDEVTQASWRCSHPCFPEAQWAPADEGGIAVHMGKPQEWTADDFDEHPIEGNEDGCPGGWYRCGWFASLQRYLRSGEVENPLLATCGDRLVREAVAHFDYERSRAAS